MNTILPLFLAVLILTIGLAAYFLVVGALFTSRLTKTQRAIAQSRGRSFWIGLVNFLSFGVVALVLYAIGENAGDGLRTITLIPSLFITGVLIFILSLGLTGIVNLLGERIFPDQSAWMQTSLGTMILTFACAVPVAGWFILFPYAGLVGFGAVILGFFQRETK